MGTIANLAWLTDEKALPWVVALILVAVQSYVRFNTPPTSRASTTPGRYHIFAGLYTIGVVLGWFMLSSTPALLAALGGELASAEIRALTPPLYAALAVTVLLSQIPYLSAPDRWLREWLHDRAHIPWEADRISRRLQRIRLQINSKTEASVKDAFIAAGLDELDVTFEPARDPRALLARVAALRHHLLDWPADQKLAGYYRAHRAEFDRIERAYEALVDRAQVIFRLVSTAKSDEVRWIEELRRLSRVFMADVSLLNAQLCQQIAHAVLKTSLTESGRRQLLERLGFQLEDRRDLLFDRLMGLSAVLPISYAILMLLFMRPEDSAFERLAMGLTIGGIYAAAVCAAVFVRRRPMVGAALQTRRAITYVAASVLALGFSLAASLAVYVAFTADAVRAVELLGMRWPWSALAAATACLTAWNLDNRETSGLRWREAGLQAAGASLAAAGVVWLLEVFCTATCRIPPLESVIPVAGATGALIGFYVPTWYRCYATMEAESEEREIRDPARATA
jgi:hypothetical protein